MDVHLILESANAPERLAELAVLAEANGITGLWTSNMHDGRDPFVNFVDAARATSKIRLGPVAVSPYELHPLKMGNALLTLNEIAEGRAHIGISAGDGGTAFAMGMKTERRLRAMRECVDIIDAMATGELMSYSGELYKVKWYNASWAKSAKPKVYVCAGGPQLLKSSAKYAQGIYLGDHHPEHVAAVRESIDPEIEAHNPYKDDFRLLNFWAWHVKDDEEAALAECRMWLAARVTPWPAYYHEVLPDKEEMQVIWDNTDALNKAFYNQDPDIPEVSRELLDKLSRCCTSCSPTSEIHREVEKMQQFKDAGLTDICLRIYDEPEKSIKLIGEHIVPAMKAAPSAAA